VVASRTGAGYWGGTRLPETTVYILASRERGGLKLVDETPGALAIFVRSTPDGIKTFESSRFKQVPTVPAD